MPKTYLVFKTPEENQELACAQQGQSLSIVLWDLDNWLRNMSKYEDKNTVDVNEVRSKIRDLLEDHDITVVG
jgi:hypothetical protein